MTDREEPYDPIDPVKSRYSGDALRQLGLLIDQTIDGSWRAFIEGGATPEVIATLMKNASFLMTVGRHGEAAELVDLLEAMQLTEATHAKAHADIRTLRLQMLIEAGANIDDDDVRALVHTQRTSRYQTPLTALGFNRVLAFEGDDEAFDDWLRATDFLKRNDTDRKRFFQNTFAIMHQVSLPLSDPDTPPQPTDYERYLRFSGRLARQATSGLSISFSMRLVEMIGLPAANTRVPSEFVTALKERQLDTLLLLIVHHWPAPTRIMSDSPPHRRLIRDAFSLGYSHSGLREHTLAELQKLLNNEILHPQDFRLISAWKDEIDKKDTAARSHHKKSPLA